MKSFNYIGFALAALSGMQLATAQEAAKLTAYAALPGAGATQLVLERGDGNGSFFYLQKGTDQLMQAKASTLKMFYIQTPADMLTLHVLVHDIHIVVEDIWIHTSAGTLV